MPTTRVPRLVPIGSLVVMPTEGQVAYRLVRNDPPTSQDFQAKCGKATAATMGLPELMRVAFSHYLDLDEIRAQNTQGSHIAAVTLTAERFHYAKTGSEISHIDVWGRANELAEVAEIIE